MDPTSPKRSWTVLLAASADRRPQTLHRRGRLHALLRHPEPIVIVLSVLALALGTVGGLMRERTEPLTSHFLNAVYVALQNFVLHGPHEGDLPVPLEIARFLAPLATAWAATAALLSPTAERRRAARVLRAPGHTVVCGLGTKGTHLARESLALGERVVVVEKDGANPSLADLQAFGAVVLLGDAREASVLARACVGRARFVITTLPEDRDNLEVALRVCEIVNRERPAPSASEERLQCYAHCADPELARLACRHRLLSAPGDAFELNLFSRHEVAARMLATDHLPAALAPAAREGRPARVALVGVGPTAEAVLLRAVGAPHVDAPAPLRVVVIDAQARQAVASLLLRHRLLAEANGVEDLCALEPLDLPMEDASAIGSALADVHAREPLDAVVICVEQDALAAKAALASRELIERGTAVFVRVRNAGGLAEILSGLEGGPVLFGDDRLTCSRSVVVDEVLDTFARRNHDVYRNQRLAADVTAPADAAQRPWQSIDADLRRSNLSQADHVPMKLAAVGRRASAADGAPAASAFSPEEVEILARLEHARWIAERVLAGWRFAAGPKDVSRRTSPFLVRWERLDAKTQEYDREPVRRLPEQLALLGLRVVPSGPAAPEAGRPS